MTITLEDNVAQWARIWSAKHNTCVSKLLGNVLKASAVVSFLSLCKLYSSNSVAL